MSVIYVNSTIEAVRLLLPRGEISPVHYWGYRPRPDDRVRSHARTRLQIVARSYIGGLDLPIVARVLTDLAAGSRALYLVTQPDLMLALPVIRGLFPRCRIVTWAWIPEEVERHRSSLRCCTHVLCLTEAALSKMRADLPQTDASLQLWGADPAFYRMEPQPLLYDIALVGLTNRDLELTKAAIGRTKRSVAVAQSVFDKLGVSKAKNIATLAFDGAADASRCLHQSRVTWIPLKVGDNYPTGYTNFIEALLCGSAVVIPKSSMLPRQVLELPGVYLYQAGSVDSLLEQTEAAIRASELPDSRGNIMKAAAQTLDGRKLERAIQNILGA